MSQESNQNNDNATVDDVIRVTNNLWAEYYIVELIDFDGHYEKPRKQAYQKINALRKLVRDELLTQMNEEDITLQTKIGPNGQENFLLFRKEGKI